MNVEDYIRDVKDFPKKDILFKDITPLLNNSEATKETLKHLLNLVGKQHIDKVVGVESRGFFFGMLLAQKLNAGFVPVRKQGKLPCQVTSQTYALEYGADTLEIHTDAIEKGDKVLLHDDVLATGGTAQAVTKLITNLGGEIIQCNFLMIIEALEGRKKLKDYKITSMLKY